jgi:hypothetical protein
VDTQEAAQRWADVWQRGWPEHDAAAITALYAEGAFWQQHPFRDPEPDFLARVFGEEESGGQRPGAAAGGEVERPGQGVAGRGALAVPAQGRAEFGERPFDDVHRVHPPEQRRVGLGHLQRDLGAPARAGGRPQRLLQQHEGPVPPGGHLRARRFPQDHGPPLRRRRLGQRPVQQAHRGLRRATVDRRACRLPQPRQHPPVTGRPHPDQMRGHLPGDAPPACGSRAAQRWAPSFPPLSSDASSASRITGCTNRGSSPAAGTLARARPAASRPVTAVSTPAIAAACRSNNWRTTPNAKPDSSSEPRARTTSWPSSSARAHAASPSDVLPIPDRPSTSSIRPRRSSSTSTAASSRSRSRSLPTKPACRLHAVPSTDLTAAIAGRPRISPSCHPSVCGIQLRRAG